MTGDQELSDFVFDTDDTEVVGLLAARESVWWGTMYDKSQSWCWFIEVCGCCCCCWWCLSLLKELLKFVDEVLVLDLSFLLFLLLLLWWWLLCCFVLNIEEVFEVVGLNEEVEEWL